MMKFCTVAAVTCLLLTASNLVKLEAITLEKASDHGLNRGARPMTKSLCQGGKNGIPFDDIANHNLDPIPIIGVCSISISSRDKVDSIQVTYVRSRLGMWQREILFRAPRHGLPRSKPTKITLGQSEYIVKVEGQTNGKVINQLTITTSKNKVYGPFGKNGSTSFSLEGYIVGFYGGFGLHLDRIGVYSIKLLKKSDAFGGTGGNTFDDTTEISGPPRVGILQMKIWAGNTIDAIQATYAFLGFDSLIANQHGMNSENLTTIDFPDGEIIIRIEGQTDEIHVTQLTFMTKRQDGSEAKYGPFGKSGNHSFTISGKVVAFYGCSGSLIDKLGVYYV